jgi:hypothetical protein
MKSEEMLMLQALKLKKLNSKGFDGPDLVEQLILQNPDSAKEKLRNICAFISPDLFGEIDSLCSLLDLSKREFVEMALVDLVAKAHAVIQQTNAMEGA